MQYVLIIVYVYKTTVLQYATVYKGSSGYVIHALPGYLPLSAWLTVVAAWHTRLIIHTTTRIIITESRLSHNNITLPTTFQSTSYQPPRPSLRNSNLHHWLQNRQWI
jgi:hypothetical protein